MEMYSEEAENLVFGTGLIESNYDYLRQWNNGVARSWWQIEPGMTGAKDTLENYLKYRQRLMWNCVDIAQVPSTAFLPTAKEEDIAELLEYNIAYAIIMCRLKYRRVPKAIPSSVEGMAKYWKDHYNTRLGKGKASEFIEKYNKTL